MHRFLAQFSGVHCTQTRRVVAQFAVRCDLIEFPSAEMSNAVDVSKMEGFDAG
jgi:hypothetical protein